MLPPDEDFELKWLSSGILHHVVWCILIDASEDRTASIIRAISNPGAENFGWT
jgi:hypothetical protein